MSGRCGGLTIAEIERNITAREIITVRCALCGWKRTGPALQTSTRGNETGMLYWQRRHAELHERERIKQKQRDARYREKDRDEYNRRHRQWRHLQAA